MTCLAFPAVIEHLTGLGVTAVELLVVLDPYGRVIGIVSSTYISRALQLADLRSFHAYPPPRGADLTVTGP